MRTEIKNQEYLTQAIASLEKKTAIQKNMIANSFDCLQENLKPINLIKRHKEIVLIAALGLGTGYLVRRLFMVKSTGLLAKVVGGLIQWGLAGIISKNAEKIRLNTGPVARRVLKGNKSRMKIINVQAR